MDILVIDQYICSGGYYQQLKLFNQHTQSVYGIEFSSFNDDQYLCSRSADKIICLYDIETSNSLHIFNKYNHTVWYYKVIVLMKMDNIIYFRSYIYILIIQFVFSDIQLNNNELYLIRDNKKDDEGVYCLIFISLKKRK
ncbi:hypothetical protein RFI_37726 [Reticulomyxa filosa]|uniref:Uncharacterized protein n=1 Tax=Reticulomyxa filosa TaxID=46433 RepID=X6LF33_RETFI|nr:hypothetical protein RFI_37726 [Reticulomyxa filosa]|eukprot:ETN99741.1 hypothetical protein RFI_37726 [Reticulomyxa filosa]